jgi:signal transduction histidine kinase
MFDADDDVVRLRIVDNGTGFDALVQTGGTGLDGMRKRASELGGSLRVSSSPGRGTIVELTLPLAVTGVRR